MLILRPLRALVAVVALAGFARAALAGPPLICHPFVTDAGARLLPWVPSRHWHSPDGSYDIANLTTDVLRLLTARAEIFGRMENMRRAAIYAEQDVAVARELLAAVLERAERPPADPRAAALAWFDAGYLLETYRQLDLVYRHEMRSADGRPATMVPAEYAARDGYALVRKALQVAPAAEIEFAASLMTNQVPSEEHASRARAGAAPASLLALNLETFGSH